MPQFTLNDGEEFACIAFAYAGMEPSIYAVAPLDLGDGTWVLLRSPVEIGDPWCHWLGSQTTEQIHDSHFVLLVKRDRGNSKRNLREAVDAFFYGFLLQGMPLHEAAYSFLGARHDGEISISHFTELDLHRCFGGGPAIDEAACRVAKDAADGITEISSSTEYRRLSAGLRALIKASRERYGDSALHEFVRALDGLIMPRIGRNKNDFVHRCQTFAMSGEANAAILTDCYDIRSNVEHMHPWNRLDSVTDSQDEGLLLQRLQQIQALALKTYLKIFTSADHRSIFRTDGNIEEFWSLHDHERRERWGPGIDMTAMMEE